MRARVQAGCLFVLNNLDKENNEGCRRPELQALYHAELMEHSIQGLERNWFNEADYRGSMLIRR